MSNARGWMPGIALVLLLIIGCGAKENSASDDEARIGRWKRFNRGTSTQTITAEQQGALEKLANLGYVNGSKPAFDASGVTINDEQRAQPGYNFYLTGDEAKAILMDMQGNVLHSWEKKYEEAFPSIPKRAEVAWAYWRRAALGPEGEIYAIFEGVGLLKLDRDSNLLWAVPNHSHHDLEMDGEGRIWVLTRDGLLPNRFENEKPVLLDSVDIVSPETGETLDRISIDQAYLDSEFAAPKTTQEGDVYHTNTIELLDGRFSDRIPAFAKGNVLLSFRNINQLAVLDPKQRKLVWVMEDSWRRQHQPTLLDNGNLLIFDNKGGLVKNGGSRVIEFDPTSKETAWMYEGSPEMPLYSELMGSAARLANGDTLIVESENGRIIELTPDKQIDWEFINPARAGENDEFIAVIPDLVRLDPASVSGWLKTAEQQD